MEKALTKAGATLEIIAPAIGGVTASDGTKIPADHKVGGGPSVLFDAVAVLPSAEGGAQLAKNPAAVQFVSDAFNHLKFLGWADAAMPLLEKAGIAADLDAACIKLASPRIASQFVASCQQLRFWDREPMVKI